MIWRAAAAIVFSSLSACSDEKPAEVLDVSATNDPDAAIEQEAKSIEQAADEAAALIEAESDSEIKAIGAESK